MDVELPDAIDVNDPAAVRAYVDAEVSRRIRAGHQAPGEVSYDIYVDRDGNDSTAREKLGFGADGQTLAWGAAARHPLTANIRAMQGDVLRAAVTGLDGDLDSETPDDQTVPTTSLSGLDYTADGEDGVSQSEVRFLLTRFQGIFPNTDSGDRQLFQAYQRNPQVRFGPEARDTMSLQEVYRTAGVTPPDGTSRPQVPGAPGSATDSNAPDPIRQAFATGNVDSGEIERKLRRLKAQLDDLVARLNAGGDPVDAYSEMWNIFAQTMNLIGGEAMMRLAPQLQRKFEDYRASIDRTADTLGSRRSGSQAGDVERGRGDQTMIFQDIQALQRAIAQLVDSISEMGQRANQATEKRGQIISRL